MKGQAQARPTPQEKEPSDGGQLTTEADRSFLSNLEVGPPLQVM